MARPSAIWGDGLRGGGVLRLSGAWTADHAAELESALATAMKSLQAGAEDAHFRIDCAGLLSLDTVGAWLIHRARLTLGEKGEVTLVGLKRDQTHLIAEVAQAEIPPEGPPRPTGAYPLLVDIGEAVVNAGKDVSNGVTFFGSVMAALARLALGRAKLRPAAVVTQLERVAMRGVPIIVLISFLVGAIIAQQSIFQLQRFGQPHLVADLVGVLVLRELAVLLTAIMVAGRSGSAFTAELGSMKMREEVDALQTMGLDPVEVLVLPRIIALLIGLPLLTFVSSMAAMAGAALVADIYGGISFEIFFARIQNIIGMNTFMVGMYKAPFMALVIGLIACIEGFAVRGSAESLGSHTTASVVKSIFVVIVVDGLFAMFFASIRY
ncbi:MAG: MlaE family lipid ABC transporter permease subunit [Beijerinckiaceae bacterium]|jgi:phospholipid/cholesterol/gamma-HCH transport system permease protein|nr:MlaE family lipid ABC transporter permease subunit [Beijerinckiaceae bacterium]